MSYWKRMKLAGNVSGAIEVAALLVMLGVVLYFVFT